MQNPFDPKNESRKCLETEEVPYPLKIMMSKTGKTLKSFEYGKCPETGKTVKSFEYGKCLET